MKLNQNKYHFVETEWVISSANTLKAYYAVDNETEEMIQITEEDYKESTNQEVGKPIRQSEIIADYQSSMKVEDLLEKHSISYYMLKKILNTNDIKKRDSNRPIEYDIDVEALHKDFENKRHNAELAIKYGISYDLVAWHKTLWRKKTK